MRRTMLARVVTVGTLAAVAVGNTGCSTMSNTEKGAGLGGALGAGAGALIGSVSGNPKTGAVIGGLLGAGAGGIIGNDVDRQDARDATARHDFANQQYAAAQPSRLTEVVELVKQGQGEQVILNHIRANRMSFALSVSDLDYLKSNGVPDRVIAEMQTGGSPPPLVRVSPPPPRTVVVREEVVVPVYDPCWGPPPVFYPRHRHRPVVGATFNFR